MESQSTQTRSYLLQKTALIPISMFCKVRIPDSYFFSSFKPFSLPYLEHSTVQVGFTSPGFTLSHHDSMLAAQAAFFSLKHYASNVRQFSGSVLDAGRGSQGADKILNLHSEGWQICGRNQLSKWHFGSISVASLFVLLFLLAHRFLLLHKARVTKYISATKEG